MNITQSIKHFNILQLDLLNSEKRKLMTNRCRNSAVRTLMNTHRFISSGYFQIIHYEVYTSTLTNWFTVLLSLSYKLTHPCCVLFNFMHLENTVLQNIAYIQISRLTVFAYIQAILRPIFSQQPSSITHSCF